MSKITNDSTTNNGDHTRYDDQYFDSTTNRARQTPFLTLLARIFFTPIVFLCGWLYRQFRDSNNRAQPKRPTATEGSRKRPGSPKTPVSSFSNNQILCQLSPQNLRCVILPMSWSLSTIVRIEQNFSTTTGEHSLFNLFRPEVSKGKSIDELQVVAAEATPADRQKSLQNPIAGRARS